LESGLAHVSSVVVDCTSPQREQGWSWTPGVVSFISFSLGTSC
jgi:hypothetical protein